jgi:hypothetical protein
VGVLLGTLATAGCSGDAAGGLDAAVGPSFAFVVDTLEFAGTDLASGETPGFNLDGWNTEAGGPTGCGHVDGRFDVDQNGTIEGLEYGIDNMAGELAAAFDSLYDLQAQIDTGGLLLLIEIRGVADFDQEGPVDVAFLKGAVPTGGVLELDSVTGRIAPGQQFDVDPASYDASGRPRVTGPATIAQGRLYMGPITTLPIDPATGDDSVPLPIRDAQVAFNPSPAVLDIGVIGGGALLDEMVDAMLAMLGEDYPRETLVSFLSPVTDLNPDANNQNCDSISLGMTFSAVHASILE